MALLVEITGGVTAQQIEHACYKALQAHHPHLYIRQSLSGAWHLLRKFRSVTGVLVSTHPYTPQAWQVSLPGITALADYQLAAHLLLSLLQAHPQACFSTSEGALTGEMLLSPQWAITQQRQACSDGLLEHSFAGAFTPLFFDKNVLSEWHIPYDNVAQPESEALRLFTEELARSQWILAGYAPSVTTFLHKGEMHKVALLTIDASGTLMPFELLPYHSHILLRDLSRRTHGEAPDEYIAPFALLGDLTLEGISPVMSYAYIYQQQPSRSEVQRLIKGFMQAQACTDFDLCAI